MKGYLNIDQLKYDIHKMYEEYFLSLLEGMYCEKDLDNDIKWMRNGII